MGRKPLYSTEQERRDAKKERERIWLKTERGKAKRSQQNRLAYERRKGPVQFTLRLPYFSKYIETLSDLTMDLSSDILLKNFNGGLSFPEDEDNEDEFIHWDQPPPYQVSPHLLDVGLEDTINALHGRRMRLQHLAELSIVKQYEASQNNHNDVWRDVHRDLVHRMLAFTKLRKTVQLFKHESAVDYEMGMHFVRWQGHAIMALKAYWIALKGNRQGEVRQVYERKWDFT